MGCVQAVRSGGAGRAEERQPGTPAFRQALRDAIESGKEVVGAHGVFNMTPTDHNGHDQRARVLVRIEKGDWKLIGDSK